MEPLLTTLSKVRIHSITDETLVAIFNTALFPYPLMEVKFIDTKIEENTLTSSQLCLFNIYISVNKFIFQESRITGHQGCLIILEPSNAPKQALLSTLKMDFVAIQRNSATARALISVSRNGMLCIADSDFTNNYGLESGGVILLKNTLTSSRITKSTFKENAALVGGAMSLTFESYLEVDDCTFDHNFAL